MLRLKKQHASSNDDPAEPPEPQALFASQSIAGAIGGGLVAVAAMVALWTALTVATGRVFPWFTLLLGVAVGLSVRRFGRGFDFRFPMVAVGLTCAGALVGNLVIALPETTRQLDAGVFEVIRGLTWRSFELFFDEVITAVDYIYAGFASAIAAFYARRRLDRHEEFALRTRDTDR